MRSARSFSLIFKASLAIIVLDYLLLMIWLPIGVSKTYGFQTATYVFTDVFNGTGFPDGWNWMLSFLATGYVITGFDAAGHIAEETKNASLAAARGIFWSAAVTSILGFVSLYHLANAGLTLSSLSSSCSCSARPISTPFLSSRPLSRSCSSTSSRSARPAK